MESAGFIRFGHWDGLKRSLLAGELLHHDIKRMEADCLDANARELEITRSISDLSGYTSPTPSPVEPATPAGASPGSDLTVGRCSE